MAVGSLTVKLDRTVPQQTGKGQGFKLVTGKCGPITSTTSAYYASAIEKYFRETYYINMDIKPANSNAQIGIVHYERSATNGKGVFRLYFMSSYSSVITSGDTVSLPGLKNRGFVKGQTASATFIAFGR